MSPIILIPPILVLLLWGSTRLKGQEAVRRAQQDGWIVTGGWRSPARNSVVGGHPQSKHMIGLAWDFRLTAPAENLRKYFASEKLVVRIVPEKDHVHVQIQGRA